MAIFKTNKESRQIQEFIKQNMVNKNYSCEYIFCEKKEQAGLFAYNLEDLHILLVVLITKFGNHHFT